MTEYPSQTHNANHPNVETSQRDFEQLLKVAVKERKTWLYLSYKVLM